jgi:hypothetical protein
VVDVNSHVPCSFFAKLKRRKRDNVKWRHLCLFVGFFCVGCSEETQKRKVPSASQQGSNVQGASFEFSDNLKWAVSRRAWMASLPKGNDDHGSFYDKPADLRIARLARRLLDEGGKEVCVHFVADRDLCVRLTTAGFCMPTNKIKQVFGAISACHQNCAALYLKFPGEYSIGTGYGLSVDGIWRNHSWLVSVDGSILETTEKRIIYFGLVLGRAESQKFCSKEL